MKLKMRKTSISVLKLLYKDFKMACVSNGQSMSDVMQDFMADYNGVWIEKEGILAEEEYSKRIRAEKEALKNEL